MHIEEDILYNIEINYRRLQLMLIESQSDWMKESEKRVVSIIRTHWAH